MPPGDAAVHRPIDPALVDAAYEQAYDVDSTPDAVGVDVARSGDDTVAFGAHASERHFARLYAAQGTNHTEQESALAERLRRNGRPPTAVDAVGEGSGLADGLADRFTDVTRYKASRNAVDDTRRDDTSDEYDDCWAQSLAALGDRLADGWTFADKDLYEQLKIAARTVAWEEKFLASRGDDGADVLRATASKDDIKQRLGRSPDHLDAALMAAWQADRDANELSADDVVVL
jgi:hypothetical protein